MHPALIVFLLLIVSGLCAVAYLLRGTWSALAMQAQVHATAYAVSYLKGGALILIAGGACFTETFGNVTKAEAAAWEWWDWAVAFWKPVAAGLACMVAFVDQSMRRAREEVTEAKSRAPFSEQQTTKTEGQT